MAGTNDMHAISDRWGRLRNFDFCSEVEPTQTWPYMTWINPASQEIKVRNGADTDWIGVGGSAGADEKVKVSADDASAGYLLPKLDAGTGIQLTELNPGGNEQVRIASTVSLDDAYNAGRIITADAGAVEIQGAGGLLSQGNVILDDGVGDSPELQLVSGTHDDVVRIWLSDSAAANQSDLTIRLAGATQAAQLIVEDSAGTDLWRVGGAGLFQIMDGLFQAFRSAAAGGQFHIRTAETATVQTVLILEHESTGVPAAGFGARLIYWLEDDDGNIDDAAAIDARWDDPTDTNEDSRIEFLVRVGGAPLAEMCRIDGTGLVMAADKMVTMPDNSWVGLGPAKGRIEFDDQDKDEVNILAAEVGVGTQTPRNVASATYGASSTILNVYEATGFARVVIQGNLYGAGLDLVDVGGGLNDKWMQLRCDGGIVKFMSILDDLSGIIADNILVMDIGTGQVGIGTATPNQALDVIGTIQASNLLGGAHNITTDANGNIIRDPSDVRLKYDIRDIEGALDKVLRLRGVTFMWKPEALMGDDRNYGLIAQEVQAIVPELVARGEDGFIGVRYTDMVGLLVEAIKQQQKQIASLSAQLEKAN